MDGVLASLPPARRRLLVALVAAAVVVVAAIAVVAGRSTPLRPVPQTSPGPVIVVPGYGGSKTGPDRLAAALRADGKDVTVLTLPGDGQGDLDAQATALAAEVKVVRDRTGSRSVDLVGYSAGGVVARLYVRDHGGRSSVRRLVTLGSPHHGTTLADLGGLIAGTCPTACQQLQRDSALLARLNQGDETPSGPLYASIWTTSDDVVLPPDSARLDGALDVTVQQLCPKDTVNHSNLPGDPAVQNLVEAFLGVIPPAVPTSVTCP